MRCLEAGRRNAIYCFAVYTHNSHAQRCVGVRAKLFCSGGHKIAVCEAQAAASHTLRQASFEQHSMARRFSQDGSCTVQGGPASAFLIIALADFEHCFKRSAACTHVLMRACKQDKNSTMTNGHDDKGDDKRCDLKRKMYRMQRGGIERQEVFLETLDDV